eukprot:gi/632980708/ref/XP_007907185.1/ PREDICTED: dual specificity protein phosphatase CDC14A-like [Callorhinchus milii]
MKHYRFTAAEAIAWIRICRPGSIIGPQQHFLEEKQGCMWLEGDIYRSLKKHKCTDKDCMGLSRIISSIDALSLGGNLYKTGENDYEEDGGTVIKTYMTQGDKLRALKSRRQPRSATTGALRLDDMKIHTRSPTQPFRINSSSLQGSMSPLKSSKVTAMTFASPKRIGRNATAVNGNLKSFTINTRLGNSLGNIYAAPEEAEISGTSVPRTGFTMNNASARYYQELNNNYHSKHSGGSRAHVGSHTSPKDEHSYRSTYSGLSPATMRYLSRSNPSLQSEHVQY